jgi:hypothetical protein
MSADREPPVPARRPPGEERSEAELTAEELEELEAERARRLRRFAAYAQAGGLAFLAVVSLGLLPTILAASYPAAGERAAVLVWVVTPAIPIALLVVAALRLPR